MSKANTVELILTLDSLLPQHNYWLCSFLLLKAS